MPTRAADPRVGIGIDPGDVHVGVSHWTRTEEGLWSCGWAAEVNPTDCARLLLSGELAATYDQIVIEGFWLKPGRAGLAQAGSRMQTAELIGLYRFHTAFHRLPMIVAANGQQATIKRMTAAGWKWRSRGHGNHAKDAEAVWVTGMGLSVRDLAL